LCKIAWLHPLSRHIKTATKLQKLVVLSCSSDWRTKAYQLGCLFKLVSDLDGSNIEMPGMKPADSSDCLLEIIHNFYIGLGMNLLSVPNPCVADKMYIMSHRLSSLAGFIPDVLMLVLSRKETVSVRMLNRIDFVFLSSEDVSRTNFCNTVTF
jgi:hypothetical protein